MNVISPGSIVWIGGDIAGIVTEVLLQGKSCKVLYRVSWWNGKDRHNEWFEEFEVSMKSGNRQEIGFRNTK